MQCQRCHGRGRTVEKTGFGQGNGPPLTLDEIAICPECYGVGISYCCEGSGLEKLVDLIPCDCNPNEAS